MKNLTKNLEEILEVETLNLSAKFTDMDEWDSLSVLSVLALLDSDFGLNMTQKEIEKFSTISDFIQFVEKNGK